MSDSRRYLSHKVQTPSCLFALTLQPLAYPSTLFLAFPFALHGKRVDQRGERPLHVAPFSTELADV